MANLSIKESIRRIYDALNARLKPVENLNTTVHKKTNRIRVVKDDSNSNINHVTGDDNVFADGMIDGLCYYFPNRTNNISILTIITTDSLHITNQYAILETGNTAPNVEYNSAYSVSWANGIAPTIQANKRYFFKFMTYKNASGNTVLIGEWFTF